MAKHRANSIVQHLRCVLSREQHQALSDGELLDRFLQEQDESAFAVLVHRHGRLVLGVSRRVLHNPEDAEDVAQATFLILARKATSIRRRDAIGSWLYQVAHRLAHKTRARVRQQRQQEGMANGLATSNASPDPLADLSLREVRAIMDEELARLPDKYRAPLLLCYFEDRTHDEAARQLGWSTRTLKVRVARGRELLRGRLVRRGLALGSAMMATMLSSECAAGHLPSQFVQTICEAAIQTASGESITGVVSSSVITLVRGAMRDMATLKVLKLAAASLMLMGFLGGSLGLIIGHPSFARAVQKPGNNAAPLLAANKLPNEAVIQPALPPLQDGRGDPLPPDALLRLGTIRLRHGAVVTSVGWSPDGKSVVSSSSEWPDDLRLWDAETGKEKRPFLAERKESYCYATFVPTGKSVAAVSTEDTLVIWDLATGKFLTVKEDMATSAVAFTADGKSFAMVNAHGRPVLMETNKLVNLRTFEHAAHTKEDRFVSVSLSGDGKLLAASDTLNKIHLFDTATGKVLHSFSYGTVGCFMLAPDGKLLASAGQNKIIHLWDTTTGKKIRLMEGHLGAVKTVAWSPDGKTLVSGSNDKTARLWDVESGNQLQRFTGPESPVTTIAFSPDGKRVAAGCGGQDNKVWIWDAKTAKSFEADNDHFGRISVVAMVGGGKMALTSGADSMIRIWDLQSGKCLTNVAAPHARPKSVDVSADGELLAAGADDGMIRVYALPEGKLLKEMQADDIRVSAVALSSDGKWLASGSGNKISRLWDVEKGILVRRLAHPSEQMFAFAFSPDNKVVCGGSGVGTIRFWDVGSGQQIRQVEVAVKNVVDRVTFSPDGKLLASAHHDSTARVWDATTGRQLRLLKSVNMGTSVEFSPDGRTLATDGEGSRALLWEVATGKQRGSFEGHRGHVMSFAFQPGGKMLVSGSTDSTALCWDLTGQRGILANKPKVSTAQEIQGHWQNLFGDDVAKSYVAMLTLAAQPEVALAKLRKDIQPPVRIDPKVVAQWIANLEDAKFAVREKALAELKKAGDRAWPALKNAQKNPPSLETQARIRTLLGNQDDPLLPIPERLQLIRSLELLERLDTAEARKLVQSLADGAPEAWLTQEAQEILKRKAS